VLFEFDLRKFDSKLSSLDSNLITMSAKSLPIVFFAGAVVLLTACASKPAPSPVQRAYVAQAKLDPITQPQSTEGAYCSERRSGIVGGAGIAQSTIEYQHSLGKCRHLKWENDDLTIIDFGEDAARQAEEMHLLQPVAAASAVTAASSVQVALTAEEIAERDCAPVSNCHISRALNDKGVVIHFTSDSDAINSEDLTQIGMVARLVAVAQFVAQNAQKKLTLLVVGHTDSTASERHNKSLSLRRAQAVAQALQINGVPANLIASQGLSSALAVTSNDTPDGRAQNRRVVITVRLNSEVTSHGN
jgi:outer membrane protein OmpA-like peptidoglycan-associated protein